MKPRIFLVCALLLVAAHFSHAQEVCYAYRAENFVSGNYPTAMAACEAMMAQYNSDSGNTATVTSTSGNNCRVTLVYANGNPTEYDKSFGTFTQITVDCPDPTACSPTIGQDKTVNLTVGWSRQSAREAAVDQALDAYKASIVSSVTRPATACDGGCGYNVPSSGADGCWHATTPSSTGLYRLSCDFVVVGNGSECTPEADAPTSPSAPPPPCDGYQGQIGGITRCVAPSGSTDAPAAAPVPYKQGNPTAGSDADSGLPSRNPTSGPSGNAGGIASPGDGGIRGGGAGGPGPGTGTGSGGTGESPQPKDPCGIPGSPPCKIDETGTPDGNGAFDAAGDALDGVEAAAVDLLEEAAGTAGKDTSWGFSFSLPTGCSAISLPAFAPYIDSIDVCEWQPMIHDLVSLVWIAVTIWTCIGMVGRTAGAGA